MNKKLNILCVFVLLSYSPLLFSKSLIAKNPVSKEQTSKRRVPTPVAKNKPPIPVVEHEKIPSALTNSEGGGCDRLGDRLVLYLKAKWLQEKYAIPFLLTPFKGSGCFVFDETEKKFEHKKKFRKAIRCKDEADFNNKASHDTLYNVDFNCVIIRSSKEEYECFRQRMKTLLQPVDFIPSLSVRENAVSIAVHMRKGSGKDTGLKSLQIYESSWPDIFFDREPCILQEPNSTTKRCGQARSPYMDVMFPLRFVPDQYYIDQIHLLTKIFKDTPLDIFIFTDHKDPEYLLKCLKEKVNCPDAVFYCRTDSTPDASEAVRDLWLMAHCHCLIRARSHLSYVAEFIGEHSIVIFPRNFIWKAQTLWISEINIAVKDADLKNLIIERLGLAAV